MQLLDHFEKTPQPSPISKKTYLEYSCYTLGLIGGSFLLHAGDLIDLLPVFEAPAGWVLMACSWLATMRLFRKAISNLLGLLLVSTAGFVLGGFLAGFFIDSVFDIGQSDYIIVAFMFWFFYTLGTLGIFALLHFSEGKTSATTRD